MRFLYLISFLFIGFFLCSINAQYDGPILIFQGKVADVSGKKLDGVQIIVKKDGQPFKQTKSGSSGKYQDIEAPFGHIYEITFKMDGYVSKAVMIDAKKGYYEDDIEPETYMKAEASMFKAQKDVDYSIVENKPVGKARIDPKSGKMDWDYVYLGQRKNEIERYLKQVAQKARQQEELFKKMVAEGNLAYNKEQYEIAILKYKEALKIKDDDSIDQKILDAQKNLALQAGQKEKKQQYDALIQKGDNFLSSNSFDNAISSYNEAKDLLPGVQLAYDKIRDANQMKEDLANAEINKNYQAKMQQAQKAYDDQQWDQAKSAYNEALQIKPNERSPKDRIIEIDNMLAKMKKDEENYTKFISQGDQTLLENNFDEAISAYENALAIKPTEVYPKDQIKKANELKAAAEAASLLDQQYNKIISKSDDLFKKTSYDLAIASYEEATALKPDEKYPKDQIVLIQDKLKEIADQMAADLEKQKLYDAAITKADGIYKDENWADAKIAYEEAKSIKPEESYPQQMIDDINIKIQRIAADAAEKRKRFDDLVANGDASFSSDNWKESKQYYNDALAVFSDEQYPKDQIAAIDKKIADAETEKQNNLLKQQEFETLLLEGDQNVESVEYAVAKEKYLAAKKLFPEKVIVDQKLSHLDGLIKEQRLKNALDSSYNAVIAKADQLRDAETWKESKNKYYEALDLKPLASYPKTQIDFINNKLSDAEKVAARKNYDDLIVEADKLLEEESYQDAIDVYNKAKQILPSEIYPNDKIRDIRRILSELESKENQYKIFINTADNEFESEKWEFALLNYKAALNLFERDYPAKKIAEITEKLALLKTENEELSQKRSKYDQLIKDGDRLYDEENLEEAKAKFVEASSLFDKEYYPQQKIAEIDIKLKASNASAEITEKYNQLITQADGLRDAKNWEEAKKIYLNANSVNPIPTYPKEQIDFINGKMKEETEAEFKLQYDKLISAADDQFNQKSYEKAIELYKRARSMNPEDSYPNSKLSEIDRILKDIESTKQDELRFKTNQDKYNKLVSQADAAKAGEEWLKAKDLFQQAYNVLPSETYPQEQIDDINLKMKQSALDDVQKQYDKIIGVADKMYSDKNYDKALELYRRAQSIRPDDSYPPEQIRKLEEERMLARDKDRDEKIFSDNLMAAKRAFEAKNYRLSLKKFQSALRIKPEAKYPIAQVKVINEILDAQKSKSKNKDKNQNIAKNNPADYQTLYGDEVTGKYSEDQIDQLINRGRIDEEYFNQNQMVLRKDGLNELSKKITDFQIDLNNKQQADFDLLSVKLTENYNNSDASRWNLIPQLDRYKDQNSYLQDLSLVQSMEKSLRNAESNSRIISRNSSIDLEREEARAMQNASTSLFVEQKMIVDNDQRLRGLSLTYDNNIANERLYNDLSDEILLKDIQRNETVNQVDNFKEDVSLVNENNIGHFKNITYSNYNSKEALDTRITALFRNSDLNRESEIVPGIDFYKDDRSTQGVANQFYGLNTTYSQYSSKEALTDRINDFAEGADVARQENSLNVNRYIDKESDIKSVWKESNTDKVYNVHVVNEMINDDLSLTYDDKETIRSMNAAELAAYNDKNMISAADKANNDQKDDYSRATVIEDMKNISITDNSDNNTQQLALDYPEGVTEKMFERKNSRGDVVEITIIRIVVRGNKGDEYRKVTSKWGLSYFKNGGVISEYIWDTESN